METRIRFEFGNFVVEFSGSEEFVENRLVGLIGELAEQARACRAQSPGGTALNPAGLANSSDLARFLDEVGAKTQVKTFLGTAVWLHLAGVTRMSTNDVREALTRSGIETVNNYADCLGKHVKAGNCRMTGHKKFELTPQGMLEVGRVP